MELTMAPSRPSTATKPAKRTTGKRGRAKEYGRAKRAYAKSGKSGIRHRARAGASGAHGYSLVARFLNTSGKLVLDDLSRSFGMSKSQLAETVGIRPETLHRKQRALAPKTQNRLREMLEILGRVADWAGGAYQALAWYRAEPLPAFGGRTAEALVKEGKANAVRDYLDHVALGGFA
jgi:uncharacterized protein (DUF2384 family)